MTTLTETAPEIIRGRQYEIYDCRVTHDTTLYFIRSADADRMYLRRDGEWHSLPNGNADFESKQSAEAFIAGRCKCREHFVVKGKECHFFTVANLGTYIVDTWFRSEMAKYLHADGKWCEFAAEYWPTEESAISFVRSLEAK